MKNINFSHMKIISKAAKLIGIATVTATTIILHNTKTIQNLCLTDVFVIIVYIVDI